MDERTLLVTYPTKPHRRDAIEAARPDWVDGRYLEAVEADRRASAVADAAAVLAWNPAEERTDAAFAALCPGQVLQIVTAGIDHLAFDRFPDGLTILSNAGAYADPMAEHVRTLR